MKNVTLNESLTYTQGVTEIICQSENILSSVSGTQNDTKK